MRISSTVNRVSFVGLHGIRDRHLYLFGVNASKLLVRICDNVGKNYRQLYKVWLDS